MRTNKTRKRHRLRKKETSASREDIARSVAARVICDIDEARKSNTECKSDGCQCLVARKIRTFRKLVIMRYAKKPLNFNQRNSFILSLEQLILFWLFCRKEAQTRRLLRLALKNGKPPSCNPPNKVKTSECRPVFSSPPTDSIRVAQRVYQTLNDSMKFINHLTCEHPSMFKKFIITLNRLRVEQLRDMCNNIGGRTGDKRELSKPDHSNARNIGIKLAKIVQPRSSAVRRRMHQTVRSYCRPPKEPKKRRDAPFFPSTMCQTAKKAMATGQKRRWYRKISIEVAATATYVFIHETCRNSVEKPAFCRHTATARARHPKRCFESLHNGRTSEGGEDDAFLRGRRRKIDRRVYQTAFHLDLAEARAAFPPFMKTQTEKANKQSQLQTLEIRNDENRKVYLVERQEINIMACDNTGSWRKLAWNGFLPAEVATHGISITVQQQNRTLVEAYFSFLKYVCKFVCSWIICVV
ncbi:hypothetical protein TcasGA2_TC000492 [Tribolium castaneum]|uniref:Uncharacterized protein n=1 Tax=Tribolium castaneum TaxID=7070 RepID=D6W9Z9_TRICA|nr:hypothetical protein TcasGA2_TC000492 [Tribolium castaneum]